MVTSVSLPPGREKMERLRRVREAIQEGLDSGPAVEWDPEEIKRAGGAERTARNGGARDT